MGSAEIDDTLLEEWALSYLARFASSEEALRRVLLRRARRRLGTDKAALAPISLAVQALLGRYRERGLLDDAAYAEGRARVLSRRGASSVAIARGLRAKGIERALVQTALDTLKSEDPEPDLAAAYVFARRRRLGPFRRAATDLARERRSFARAGFDRRTAEAILACRDPEEIERLLSERGR
jgi:regulatory protein